MKKYIWASLFLSGVMLSQSGMALEETITYGYRINPTVSISPIDMANSELTQATNSNIRYGSTMSNEAWMDMTCAKWRGQNEAKRAECRASASADKKMGIAGCAAYNDSSFSYGISGGVTYVYGDFTYTVQSHTYSGCINEVNATGEYVSNLCEVRYQQLAGYITGRCGN